MLTVVNRLVLGVVGLMVTVGGLAVLLGALDVPRRWGLDLPSGWPWTDSDTVLLSDADRTRWREQGWWWPVVLTGLALVVLLTLWWLLAQLRRPRLSEVLVDSGDGAGALLRGRALEDAVAAETEALPGAERARVRLEGRRAEPRARVTMAVAPDAEPGALVERFRTEALENARTSAGLGELPAEVRLVRGRHRAERIS